MVYKKGAPRKKYSYKKKGASRGRVYGAAAGQLYKDVMALKAAINVEYKVQDTSYGPLSITTAPTFTLENGLLRGDDFNQRNGRSVKWTQIYQRLTVQSTVANTSPVYVRYLLFWVKDPSATAPTALQMFSSATPNINAMLNLNVRKDFIILTDKVFKIMPVAGGSSSAFFKIFKKTSMHTIFNAGNTGSISDIESGALYSMVWTDTAVVANQPAIYVQSRCRYIDN